MKTKSYQKGVTLIELLIALMISGIIVAAIYRMFVAQTRSYSVQDQVSEVQQNVRNAMEILTRDIRMAGFDDVKWKNGADIHPIVVRGIDLLADNGFRVQYEHENAIRRVTYSLNANNQLVRSQDEVGGVADPPEEILDNVNQFAVRYFVDTSGDRRYHSGSERTAANVPAGANVVAVRVQLSARPASNNLDINTQVSPRGLDTVVTMRNQLFPNKRIP